MNSRANGKRGALDCRNLLREFGYEAHRGQQHQGGAEGPHVIHDIPGVHVEVKRTQAYNPDAWLQQAVADASIVRCECAFR